MIDCEHDWRVDPRFIYTSNPPKRKAVCLTCHETKFVSVLNYLQPSDDPKTWPKIGELDG